MKGAPTVSCLSVQLGEAEGFVLASLVGQPVLRLQSPSLEACRLWYAASSFSIRLRDEFVVVESDWRETQSEALDYHVLAVSRAPEPFNIPHSTDDKGHRVIGSPVSTVQIGAPRSPVHSISVLQREIAGQLECVRYDAGLLFSLEDGRRFVLAARQSIQGGLECATVDQAIEELLAEVKIRATIR